MMLITLRNDFHGSCIAIRANALPHVITPSRRSASCAPCVASPAAPAVVCVGRNAAPRGKKWWLSAIGTGKASDAMGTRC